MPHPFHEYVARQVQDRLKSRRVVVWYDKEGAFQPFIDELPEADPFAEPCPRVTVGETVASLARFDGSYFGLKLLVEPLVAVDEPQPLLLYVPAVKPEAEQSVLMELEKAGGTYEPTFRTSARLALRSKYTDGDIDGMLASENVGYGDVVAFFEQAGGDGGSVLKVVFQGIADPTELLAKWLADDQRDVAIEDKGAKGELYRLIDSRLGYDLGSPADLADARIKTARYVLVNEFLEDLASKAPMALSMIPVCGNAEQTGRIRDLCHRLRQHHVDAYIALADQVEAELHLATAKLEPADLGAHDTFRFEERALLGHCGQRIAAGEYAAALQTVEERDRSFWVDRDVARLAQWQVCGLAAELGAAVASAAAEVGGMGTSARAWVDAYTRDGGWFRADQLFRNLEAVLAGMDDEVETETAIDAVRQRYEQLAEAMANGFSQALRQSGWSVPGVLHQTAVFPTVVEARRGRVAYFLVDSLRYGMGAELAAQFADAEERELQPAIAALPSITPVGMAALLPGASASFSVVESKGLAARIGSSTLPDWQARCKHLKAERPNALEMTLDQLLQKKPASLAKQLGDASLVVIRSTEIDTLGEAGNDWLARQVMNTMIGNLARGIRALAKAGIDRVVVAADHGHQFVSRKETDMQTGNPGGEAVKVARRCWVGRGGTTPPSAVRVTGAELGYDTDLDFIFPTGLAVFQTQGGLSYHHGGISLQEMVIPVLSLRLKAATVPAKEQATVQITECPEEVTNRTISIKLLFSAHLLNNEPLAVRVSLLSDGQEAGAARMARDAEFDREKGTVTLQPGVLASVALVLAVEDRQDVQIVVQDAATDVVLAQSATLPVRLGI